MADLRDSICDLASEPLKTWYLYYPHPYGHQTWQGGDIQWGAPTYKVKWFLSHVLSWCHVIN